MVESQAEIDGAELEVLRAGIRLMALRALGSGDIADEVAQESIVRAFHALRSTRPERLGPFVAGIARHVIADIIRARPRETRLDDLAGGLEPQTSGDPLAMLCDASEQGRVHHALGLLGAGDRELLRLVYFEGLSLTEIAQRLSAPPERIRQRKLRALARLRVAFGESPGSAQMRHVAQSGATIVKSMITGTHKTAEER